MYIRIMIKITTELAHLYTKLPPYIVENQINVKITYNKVNILYKLKKVIL